jgi:hypothetical protein
MVDKRLFTEANFRLKESGSHGSEPPAAQRMDSSASKRLGAFSGAVEAVKNVRERFREAVLKNCSSGGSLWKE